MISAPRSPLAFTSAALLIAAAVIGFAVPSAAATSRTIHLVGRVLPRAEVILSRLSVGASRNPAFASTGFSLGNIGVWGNGSKFLVTLVSHNAEQTGRTSLVDPASGAVIGYRLRYAGAKVEFVAGEASLDAGLTRVPAAGAAKPLDVELPPDANPGRGHFEDHLTIVITAR